MKKIYNLIDKHFGEVIYSAKTRRILEESLMDMFMEDFQYECQIAFEEIEDLNKDDIKGIWDRLINWYKEVYTIDKSYLI